MKKKFTIGKEKTNDIILKDSNSRAFHAEVNYQKGHWLIQNVNGDSPLYINTNLITTPTSLEKYDQIKIGSDTIHWANYLYEGERQELYLKDFLTFQGRISRKNFRVLNLLFLGLAICIFFLPELVVMTYEYVQRRRTTLSIEEFKNLTVLIQSAIYLMGYALLILLFILTAIKRMRDTQNPLWKILIPFVNLKILYFEESKRYPSIR